jgi:hypothetical protein
MLHTLLQFSPEKMKLQITDIEFDLTDDCGEYIDTEMLQDQLQNVYIGQFWDVTEEDELADLISDKSGWCVNSINYKQIK